ncbi:DsbA family protein [Streptomyces sp. NPDC002666]
MKIHRAVRAAVTLGLVGAFAGCAPGGDTEAKDARPAARTKTAGYANTTLLPERPASDGTTIVVGNPDARSTVHVYEDPRCPVVEEYERTGARGLKELLLKGEIKAEYTFASFKDESLGGDGSKRAVNALRAAVEKGKFFEYHALLIANQPVVERRDGYTTESLLSLAKSVPGLRDEAFDRAVRTMKYRSFVKESQQAYEQTGDDPIGPGTPTVVVNAHTIDGGLFGAVFDEELFGLLVTDLHERPYAWATEYEPLKESLQDAVAES